MPDDSDKRRGRNLSEPVPSLGVPELPTGADTRAPTLPPPENSSIDPDLQETQIIGDEDQNVVLTSLGRCGRSQQGDDDSDRTHSHPRHNV